MLFTGILTRGKARGMGIDAAFNWLSRGNFSGVADGKQGIVSFWINPSSAQSATGLLIGNNLSRLSITKSPAPSAIVIQLLNTSGAAIGALRGAIFVDAFSHVVAAWNLQTQTAKIYVNDVDLTDIINPLLDQNVDYTTGNWFIGSTGVSSFFIGCLVDFYLNLSEFIDLTVTANRRKFITSDLRHVSLGANGELPTGNTPAVFCSGPGADAFATNKGSGGGFTVNDNGGFTVCRLPR